MINKEKGVVMYRINRLPAQFVRARLATIDKKLSGMPCIYTGSHSGKLVIRSYLNGRRHEYMESSRKGRELLGVYNIRNDLISLIYHLFRRQSL